MSNILNRDLQLEILRALAELSPRGIGFDSLCNSLNRAPDQGDTELARQLWYLDQHELIDLKYITGNVGEFIHSAKITHKGLDFLQDDGGLSAVLGIVTVRFERETLQALLLKNVDAAEAEPSVKDRVKKAILEGSTEMLKDTTKSLLELAWKNGPDAFRLLQAILT